MLPENKLKTVRLEKGFSQLDLSAKTRISPGTISNIESGKIYPYPGWRKRLSRALGLPENELFPEAQ